MNEHAGALSAVLERVRTRWRAAVVMRVWMLAALAVTACLGGAWIADRLFSPSAPALIGLWAAAVIAALASAAWLLAPARRRPSDAQVARFIEERCPELEDSLATAVEHAARDLESPVIAAVAADAARRVAALDTNRVVGADVLRRRGALAAAATIGLVVVTAFAVDPFSRAADAFSAYAFPERIGLQVDPGNVKVRAGSSVRIVVRLSGTSTVVEPTVRVQDNERWQPVAMERTADGFVASFDDLQAGFRYDVVAAAARSPEYTVSVVHPPRVSRIDVRYEYPAGFGMQPRVEEDGGDIYGPAGTKVRLAVHTDKAVTTGALTLDDGRAVPLAPAQDGELLTGTLTIAADGSYRVALTDRDGQQSPGDTQYFIRTLLDSPPDVHITRPASDKSVTPIEEVPVEAKADDDFGIAAFDLVFSIRGGQERAVPFRRTPSGQTVTGRSTIYLEDLGVRPGDFVTFYARARDISRGKRSSEARSDMYFLEVKPFEEEFVAAQSGAGGGNGQGEDRSLEALISAQKDVITATWRLDRRGRDAGASSGDDVRAVARAQAEVRRRVMSASGDGQRADEIRRRLGGASQKPAGDESDAHLVKAAGAMEQARTELEALSTAKALPHEMTALNGLLRAQAEIRRREVQRQEASNSAGNGGSNRQGQDLSSLFDRELARQQTNYETPTTAETREQKPRSGDDALERIRELARRQEALNREQEKLAKQADLSEEERRRQLERLTREQSDLRQQAEDLSRQLARSQGQQREAAGKGQGSENQGQRGETGRALQQAADEMKNAASGLRRRDGQQASASGRRALEQLRAGEKAQARREAESDGPDERRRQLGELRMESRELADAQRRLGRSAVEGSKERQGVQEDGKKRRQDVPEDSKERRQQGVPEDGEAARRRAAEQERLAERMQRLERSVRERAGERAQSADGERAAQQQRALGEAMRELEQQKLSERMRNAASAPSERARQEAQEIARALDRLGSRLADAAGESAADRKSAEQMARARELRDQLEAVDRQLSDLQRNSASRGRSRQGTPLGRSGTPGEPGSVGTTGQSAGRGTDPGRAGGRGTGESAANGAWEQARELIDKLRQEQDLAKGTRDLAGFNPGLSAPGTEAFKQDFARWEQLKVQLAAALERLESDAAAKLRARAVQGRLNAGRSQAVPDEYRELVNDYYRALARPFPARPQAEGR
jgi:hypothetical protein